jgi:hypothetical protein
LHQQCQGRFLWKRDLVASIRAVLVKDCEAPLVHVLDRCDSGVPAKIRHEPERDLFGPARHERERRRGNR